MRRKQVGVSRRRGHEPRNDADHCRDASESEARFALRVGHVNRRPQHGLSINYQLQEMVATVQVVSIRCLPEEIRFEVPVERLLDGSKVFGESVSIHHSTVY